MPTDALRDRIEMLQVEADVRKEAIERATAICGQTGYRVRSRRAGEPTRPDKARGVLVRTRAVWCGA